MKKIYHGSAITMADEVVIAGNFIGVISPQPPHCAYEETGQMFVKLFSRF